MPPSHTVSRAAALPRASEEGAEAESLRAMGRSIRRADVDISAVWSEGPGEDDVYDLRSLFGNEQPVELELGSGKGLFLLNQAHEHPERNFLGIEWSRKYAQLAASRAVRQGLTNIRFVSVDARVLVSKLPDACLQAVHVYFPDPWWKKRHHKRRMVTPALVAELARALEDGGQLWLVTDVGAYFDILLEVLDANRDLVPIPPPAPHQPRHDMDYLTHFERKYRLEGRSIHRAGYARRPRGSA